MEVVLLVCFVMGYLFFNSSSVRALLLQVAERSLADLAVLEKSVAAACRHEFFPNFGQVISFVRVTAATRLLEKTNY